MNTRNIQDFRSTSQTSNGFCRFCGRQDLKVIDIHSEEGKRNDIWSKIKMHIPFKLVQSKEPPFECCLECMSTILSWHKFVLKALETNERISNLKNVISTPIVNNERRVPQCSVNQQDVKHDFDKDKEERTEQTKIDINTSCEKYCGEDEIEVVNIIPTTDDDSFNDKSKGNLQSTKPAKHRRKKFEVENRYFCELCEKGFTRKFDMQRHEKLKHDGIDSSKSENRKGNREIIDKCRIYENGKTVYECHICQQRTNQSYNLIRHLSIHTGVKLYVCHICGKSFRLDSSFRKHIKHFHEGVKNYRCEICDKNFGAKTARDEHLNTHSGYRPYSCDICQKAFKQKSSLYVHKLYHNKNFKFECAVCNKKFRRAQELVVHDRIHTGHKPYSCTVCGIKFRRSQDLKKHEGVHSKKNVDWKCQICESRFTQERFLKLHRKVHALLSRTDG